MNDKDEERDIAISERLHFTARDVEPREALRLRASRRPTRPGVVQRPSKEAHFVEDTVFGTFVGARPRSGPVGL